MVLGLGCKSEEEGGRGCIFPDCFSRVAKSKGSMNPLSGKARVRVGVS